MLRLLALMIAIGIAALAAQSPASALGIILVPKSGPACQPGWTYNPQYFACFSPAQSCSGCISVPQATCVYSSYTNTRSWSGRAQDLIQGHPICPTAPPIIRSPSGTLLYSDIRMKRDIAWLARLDSGLDLYRFRYKWSDQVYVGVMAQEVRAIFPDAVVRDPNGYLRVDYERLGLHMQTWAEWVASKKRNRSNITPISNQDSSRTSHRLAPAAMTR